ncbi:MAG TPA: prolipoprotein diacylglyceryl transferase [Fulvivirga sp.]|nr:prolipoprotein diacylglyceryl transferase [Fulvivirga sp.]
MHPVLFKVGDIYTVYSYGFFIVIGAILGVAYLAWQGKKQFKLTFDQVNTLFLMLLLAGLIGGKLFLFFENPSYYSKNFSALLTGRGFVFYGSLLFCIPTMLYFFKKHKLPTMPMLDIMAVTTCIVHFFGRIGCFMAGCCHGIEWHGPLAVIFTDKECFAPLNTPLHPTQLYSASVILFIMILLLILKKHQKFDGQLFLTYLMLYAIGRSILEVFRGDLSRGFVIDGYLSNSQFISLIILIITGYLYVKYWRRGKRTIE